MTMSDAIRVTTNVGAYADRFNRYLQRTIQISRLTTEQVVRREVKGLVKFAFLYTPPMAGRSFAKGFSASKKAIRASLKQATVARNSASISRLLERTRSEQKRTEYRQILQQLEQPAQSVVQFVKRHQKPSKRYPADGPKHFVTVETRKQVQLLLEKTIGVTAAGWCAAATSLGVTFPDWIGRWRSRNSGTVSFTATESLVEFKALNPNRHTDSRRIQRALDAAFYRQADSMRRQLLSAIARGVLRREDVFGR
jgi:hypothetical protein